MLSVYQLAVPTPYPVGPVNVFFIKNDPITLIDAGPDTFKAKNILRNTLKSLGVDLSAVKRIVITHSHPDHCGLASWLSDAGGAEIYVHPYELRRMTGDCEHVQERMPFIVESGLPEEELYEVLASKDQLPEPVLKNKNIKMMHGGEDLLFDDGSLQVLHLPGHAPGHLCLFEPDQGYFFSGDFMLPHITPNPLLEPDPEAPFIRLPVLRQYFTGMEIVNKMDIKLVWPGHGGVFNDFRSVIKMGYVHHQKQFKTIIKVLGKEEKNCYQITKSVYPSLKGWNIFMGISEIQAHLDYLFDTGKVKKKIDNGVAYYWNTGR